MPVFGSGLSPERGHAVFSLFHRYARSESDRSAYGKGHHGAMGFADQVTIAECAKWTRPR